MSVNNGSKRKTCGLCPFVVKILGVSNYFQIVFYNTVLYFACIYFLSLLRNNRENLDSICYQEEDKSVISFLF